MKSKFPNAEMIGAGEVRAAIAQTPNYTSHENGRPRCFGEMINQGVGVQTTHGLEEIDYDSPMYRGLRAPIRSYMDIPISMQDRSTSASVADDDYGTLPASPMPKKVAW